MTVAMKTPAKLNAAIPPPISGLHSIANKPSTNVHANVAATLGMLAVMLCIAYLPFNREVTL